MNDDLGRIMYEAQMASWAKREGVPIPFIADWSMLSGREREDALAAASAVEAVVAARYQPLVDAAGAVIAARDKAMTTEDLFDVLQAITRELQPALAALGLVVEGVSE